jgi:type III pantothenate kinase
VTNESEPVQRVVADLGNSRLKWGLLAPDGTLARSVALPLDRPDRWESAREGWGLSGAATHWTIASVNPPLAERLIAWITARGRAEVRLLRSAAEVPVAHALEQPEATGVDRALAAWEARRAMPRGQPGQVVSCGTAITVEWIAPDGVWQGGAIAPGLGLSARALHQRTAQLPLVLPEGAPPEALGTSTIPALRAGLFWGAVGILRELIARQRSRATLVPWEVWTGGDAALLAPWVSGDRATIRPDLVLEGLAALPSGGRAGR